MSNEGHVIAPKFIPQGLNTTTYIKVLDTLGKPWIKQIAQAKLYAFQQDSTHFHIVHMTMDQIAKNVHYCHSQNVIWFESTSEVSFRGREASNTKDSLKTVVMDIMAIMNEHHLKLAWSHSQSSFNNYPQGCGYFYWRTFLFLQVKHVYKFLLNSLLYLEICFQLTGTCCQYIFSQGQH